MKLSISNIAWNNKELESYLKLLQKLDCNGVEISPSSIWAEPTEASDLDITHIKQLIKKYNLEIPSFHAILYNRPDLSIFKNKTTRNQTICYIKKIIKLANNLSAKNLIYGSPNSRHKGNRPYKEYYDIAIEVFKELAKECKIYDVCLCIEPVESSKNNFILNSKEGYNIVKDVDDTAFRLLLDTGDMFKSKEDFNTVFEKYKDVLKHVHLNDFHLKPPGTNGIDHSIIAKSLIE